jgi:D-amino-acid dehydrogenase
MRASTSDRASRAAPLLRDLNLASRARYEELVTKLSAPVGYARRGLLMICRTKKALEAEARIADQAGRLGLRADVLDCAELERLEPEMHIRASGGVFFHDDAHLTPSSLMLALRYRVESRGAKIRCGATVTGISSSRGRIDSLNLGSEEVRADEFVLAAGAWTGKLAGLVGLRLPLLSGQGFGFTVENPPELPRHPAILVEARVAVTPMMDGLRFVGTLELGHPADPLKWHGQPSPVRQISEETHPPELPPSSITSKRLQGMKKGIPAYYPEFDSSAFDVPSWQGDRPCSPDGLPYIGRTQYASNLVIATGHAMMGMSLGPITGHLVAQLVSSESPSISLELLSPDRYA